MASAKSELRQYYLEQRRGLTPEEVTVKSDAIHCRLLALPEVAHAHTLLCYVSSKDNEVDTIPLLQHFLEVGVTVLVPIAHRGGVMEWSHLIAMDDLAPGRFGILEPRADATRITPPPPDAPVLMPGIAFTRDGWRIGYGGGFFDRFLVRHEGRSIALAFDVQIMEKFAPEEFDMPVSYVVTETEVYRRPMPSA